MKKTILFVLSILLLSAFAFAQNIATAGEQSTEPAMKKESVVKPKKEAAPKTDAEIDKCIEGKFANSEKLKSQGFSVTVSNGEATLTGNARNAGSKGAATRIAQSCGAKTVKNNITAPAIVKPKKTQEDKAEKNK